MIEDLGRHPGESRGPVRRRLWVPAFAGMTTGWLLLGIPLLHAQGMLPLSGTPVETSSATQKPLLIGDIVHGSLAVTGQSGEKRTLLSYKTALDILVVAFISTSCEMNRETWPQLRRLHENYKDWHVSFVAVNTPPTGSLPDLSQLLIRERLPWPAAADDSQTVIRSLRAAYTPEVTLIDESGTLRYRGPVSAAGAALGKLIGHSDPITDPEPPMAAGCPLP